MLKFWFPASFANVLMPFHGLGAMLSGIRSVQTLFLFKAAGLFIGLSSEYANLMLYDRDST